MDTAHRTGGLPAGRKTLPHPPTAAAQRSRIHRWRNFSDRMIKPGDTNLTIDIGGMSRRYIMHIPPGYDGKTPMPMVIDWHPLTQTGSYQRGASGYAALSDREGFVTLFPHPGPIWRCTWPAPTRLKTTASGAFR